MKRALLIAALAVLSGCIDETNARRTSFEARGVNGRRVRGTVCKGWFKGSTIRLD